MRLRQIIFPKKFLNIARYVVSVRFYILDSLMNMKKMSRWEQHVGVPEWLSGMTRNHVGSARAGSNPAAHAQLILFCVIGHIHFQTPLSHVPVFFYFWRGGGGAAIPDNESLVQLPFLSFFFFFFLLSMRYVISTLEWTKPFNMLHPCILGWDKIG